MADAFVARQAVCPSCGTLNRVPLRGFAQTESNQIAVPSQARVPAAARRAATGTRVLMVLGLLAAVGAAWLLFSPMVR